MTRAKHFALHIALLTLACGPCTLRAAQNGRIVLPASVVPSHYAIEFRPDAQRLRFSAHVAIDVEVRETTRAITLNAAGLEFGTVRLRPSNATPQVQLDPKRETAIFAFSEMLAPGRYTLEIDYRGRINPNPAGLFALDYTAADKTPRRALFTQFENTDARRFVPCWDEPGIKATYDLTAIVAAGQLAVSNMPIARTTPMPGGLVRVRFQRTPKMSMYLLFFASGDLERIHRQVGKVDLGLIVKRGSAQQGRFALEAATRLLPYFNDYFATPYPLPKLDLIAGPGVSQFFGAMENWGAIFSFENDLLIDADTSTLGDRQRVFGVIAHEMAHQWFGDLVTMAWWDDVWLNEGFASWMEKKAPDALNPHWSPWLQDATNKQEAMRVDAAAGTHPVISEIHDVAEAAAAFDTITYNKGAEIIRMLEAYAGSSAFRDGVRRYIREHAYGTAVTEDLWTALDAVSARKITDIAHDFTLRAGVPLVSVDSSGCDRGALTLQLRQTRFAVDDSGRTGAQVWRVPLAIRAALNLSNAAQAGTPAPAAGGTLMTVQGASARAVAIQTCGPVIVNAGQASYTRVRYSQRLLSDLADRFAGLAAVDQLGVLNDTTALAQSGDSPTEGYLYLLTRVPARSDPVVWLAVIGQLRELDHFYDGLPGQAAFRAFAAGIVRPLGRAVSWDPKAGEEENVALEREAALSALGEFGDAETIAAARRRFASYLRARDALSAASRAVVLGIVARHADPKTWEALHALARAAHDTQEQQELYSLLGLAEDAALFRRMQEIAISDEVPATLRPVVLSSHSSLHPADSLSFAIEHWRRIEPLIEPNNRFDYLPHLIQGASDTALIARLEAFNAQHHAGTARATSDRAIARIRYNAAVRARLGAVDRWIAAHSPGHGARS